MAKTSIEWATHSANWQTGCTKISPACTHCYALEMSRRLTHMGQERYRGSAVDATDTTPLRWSGRIQWDADAMRRAFQPLQTPSRCKPRRVFLGSMTDLFHDDSATEALEALATAIRAVDSMHRLLLLTKRPQGILDWQRQYFPDGLPETVWVGVTVEDQRRANERIPVLLQVEASIRYLSCEPLVGPVVLLGEWIVANTENLIDWIIAGGESGRGARPSDPRWFESLQTQARWERIPFLFKQWGEWAPGADGKMVRLGKHRAGRSLGGHTYTEFPPHPAHP